MEGLKEEEEEERMAVVDFDMLCASVALQTQGVKIVRPDVDDDDDGEFGGGVQRMWEGDLLDCLDDPRIAVQSACCPCYRFGKNMARAKLGVGPCFLQGCLYLLHVASILVSFIAFGVTKEPCFVYMGVASAIARGLFSGYTRTRIRKQFNIGAKESCVDDSFYHLICPCCAMSQESRTLEINNVQDGVWHGRGDTICVGSYGEGSKEFSALQKTSLMPTLSPEYAIMDKTSHGSNHLWNVDAGDSQPLVAPSQ